MRYRARGRVAGLAIVALAGVLGLATVAQGHFQTSVYTWNSCDVNTAKRVDPVNLIFYAYATSTQTREQIVAHTGWTNSSGSTQHFRSHGACGAHHAQRASGGLASSRTHVRIRQTYHASSGGSGTTTAGSAHHEDLVLTCGHAVDKNGDQGSGFDQGRRTVRKAFSSNGHTWSSVYWGNTRNFKQCDGDYAGSDGWVVWIRIHSNDH